jgi:invasion protein IalB
MLLAFLGLGPISAQAVAASHEMPPSTVEPAAAVGPRLITQSFGAWTYRCQEALVDGKPSRPQCELDQDVSVQQGDKTVPVMTIVFAHGADGKGHAVTVRVPLGIRLKSGLSLAADDAAPLQFPFDFCGQRGCWVTDAAADPLIQALKPAKTGRAKVTAFNGQDLTIEFSPNGLVAGLAALDGPPPSAAKSKN